MLTHIRANLWLLLTTLLLCCVLYPLTLLGIGQAAFPDRANGSLIYGTDGKVVASRLIAHEVKGDQYFQPRPSACGYNGAASGASNYAASNPALRERVARSLAPLARYGQGPRHGEPVADDVVKWFRDQQPNLVADWATSRSGLAQAWVKSDDAAKDFVKDWFKQRPDELKQWKQQNPGKDNPTPEDLAVAFFVSFSRHHPATWVTIEEKKDAEGKSAKRVTLVPRTAEDSADIAAVFFDMWRDAHPDVALEDVPADLVMASGSGLDPHVTLAGALYQLPRVAGDWAKRTGTDPATIRRDIERLLHEHTIRQTFGVPLINVAEVNRALHAKYAAARP